MYPWHQLRLEILVLLEQHAQFWFLGAPPEHHTVHPPDSVLQNLAGVGD